ncbi:acyl-CoA dehydrogenase family protein [Pelosinus sp. UFO1]|uniref:acyl-CoA dehydrogenase family protein n=1 Tax=Pelosinus sp. UFO1 TaxID=484770 RepID=UPI0004D18FE5|nr:acyl-CoA dehydrogenase family protein [Pelosinus sp. UFO1]AIF49652.1 Butyryl-CoA dehydrogenase [Pelosinus sp. UFO1]
MSISEKHIVSDVVDQARLFCQNNLQPIARELDINSRFPTELLPIMVEAGFFGINYDVEYGGSGYDSITNHLVAKEIAKVSAGVALTFHVHWMAVDVLLKFGNEAQKQKYLPALLRGEKVAAYTVSEVQAGSDAAGIKATAANTEAGWLLNGAKFFCTNGGLADIYFVALKTDVEAGAKGISMFIVEKGTTGFEIGAPVEKMGCRSSYTTALTFNNCVVPQDNIIGDINAGFKIAMYGLVGGRLGMASMGLGIAEAALESAAKYANRRVAFGKPLNALFAVQEMLADMYVKLEAANLLVWETAKKRDSGKDYALETSVAKLFVTEVVNEVCHKALQIFGGHGYMKYNDVERYARDARLLDIGVGASEVLKMVVGTAVAKLKGS